MITRALTIAVLTIACSAPAATPAPTPTPAAATTAAASATPAAATLAFQVQPGSKAIVRVREQLVSLPAPNDAVLETSVTGSFDVRSDGTFAEGSRLVADLAALRSDSGIRDNYVRGTTLDTRRYPTATFTPKRAVGLTLPLPASGDLTFTVEGTMRVRDVDRDVTFDVRATRSGSEIRAIATNAPAWTFGDFGLTIPRVSSVLSIVDEIRLEVQLVARDTAAR